MYQSAQNLTLVVLCSLSLLIILPNGSLAQNKKRNKDKKKDAQYQPIKDNSKNSLKLVIDDKSSADEAKLLNARAEESFIDGMKHFMLEDYLRAIDAFQKAASMAKEENKHAINYKIGQTYFLLNKFEIAELYAQNAFEGDKKNKYYYLLLAKIYEAQLKHGEATKIYENMLTQFKDSPEYYYDLANLYLRLNQSEKALSSYDKLEKIIGVNESVSMQKQKIYIKANQNDKAISEARKLRDYYPTEGKYAVNLAELLINANKTQEAQAVIEKSLKEGMTDARFQLLLAKLQRDGNDTKGAYQNLKLAFANPDLESNEKIELLITYMQGSEASTQQNEFINLAETIVKTHPDK